MKKIFILLSVVCAMALVSCSNDDLAEENEKKVTKWSDIKFDITVADLAGGPATRAAKKSWEEGDKINIWFDDMDVMSLMYGGLPIAKGLAELTLTYQEDGTWKPEFDKFYATHISNDTGKHDGFFYTIKGEGILHCLYEGSNDISKYGVNASGSDYIFYMPTNNGAPITPLMCWGRCLDEKNNQIPATYTYDEETQTITATIDSWTMLTMIQVVVYGLDSSKASNYTLSCNNMYNVSSIYVNSEEGEFYSDGETEEPTCGVSNDDGVAFCFNDMVENAEDFVFTLSDGTNTYSYTATPKEPVTTSSDAVKFIKIDKSKFGL